MQATTESHPPESKIVVKWPQTYRVAVFAEAKDFPEDQNRSNWTKLIVGRP